MSLELVLTIIFASFAYVFIEEPFRELSGKISFKSTAVETTQQDVNMNDVMIETKDTNKAVNPTWSKQKFLVWIGEIIGFCFSVFEILEIFSILDLGTKKKKKYWTLHFEVILLKTKIELMELNQMLVSNSAKNM